MANVKKILLIESDKTTRTRIANGLIEHGCVIIDASDGAIGVQKALQELPDIILCDNEAKSLNGYQVYNTLQQINSTSIIPFVFLTKNAEYENVRAAMNLGIDDCIVKPVDLKELTRLIDTRLEKQEKIINIADQKFNTLMEYSFTGALILQDEKISYVNHKVCEMLGYSKRELQGMSLVNIIYKDDIPLVIDKIGKCFNGIRKEMFVEFRAIHRDQDLIDVEMSGSIINVDKKVSLIGSVNEKSTNYKGYMQEGDARKVPIHLTKRELQVLQLICQGLSNAQIANKLSISERTVEGHRANLLNKTECNNSVKLAVYAIKHGLFSID